MARSGAFQVHRVGFCFHEVPMDIDSAIERSACGAQVSQRIWQDILSGEAERSPALLARFLVLSYADLKRFRYYYW